VLACVHASSTISLHATLLLSLGSSPPRFEISPPPPSPPPLSPPPYSCLSPLCVGLSSEQRWQLTPFLFTSTKSGYDTSQAEGFEFGNHLSDWLKVHPYNDAWETVPRYDVRR
jgi:hypothetical protein